MHMSDVTSHQRTLDCTLNEEEIFDLMARAVADKATPEFAFEPGKTQARISLSKDDHGTSFRWEARVILTNNVTQDPPTPWTAPGTFQGLQDPPTPWTSPGTFQDRVWPWLISCFGQEITADKIERNHRFLEEAIELVQATGCTQSEAHQLVDYVFNRPVGDPPQEVGGVMVTLAALCLANDLDMHDAGEVELARIWTKVEAIRAKQAAKPKHSPLPQ
jgi:hypothetical protein